MKEPCPNFFGQVYKRKNMKAFFLGVGLGLIAFVFPGKYDPAIWLKESLTRRVQKRTCLFDLGSAIFAGRAI